jgi:hypothetical protein
LVGQSFAGWSAGLIERLTHEDKSRGWVRDLLVHMRAGLVPVQAVLALRLRQVTRVVFDDFLGDVQLYAEHAPTRGAAVRRFHDVMARIDAQHAGERPQYTIVAHSLGTVLSLDALAFAHSRQRSRAAVAASGDPQVFHLPGYHDGGELPEVDWALRVDNFVTLGSPIDKFLLLWPQAWGVYGDPAWLDPEFVARRPARIRHLNYCDEQDPVGHELDLAHSAPVVRALFEQVEERVYARYVLPGVAHVGYWRDDALFRRIVDIAVDGRAPAQASAVSWFSNGAFFGVLLTSSVALPVLGWLVATILCAYMLSAIKANDYAGVLLYLTLCSVTVAGTIWLGHLMVMWRQVLHLKRVRPVASLARTLWRVLFRVMIYGTPPLWAFLTRRCASGEDMWYNDSLPQAATVLATIVSTSLLVSYVAVRANWRTLRRARALDWSAIRGRT